MPYITASRSPSHTVYSAGFEFSLRLITDELARHTSFHQVGALQLPSAKRFAQLLANAQELLSAERVCRISSQDASAISGIPISSAAFFAPSAGYISPSNLVAGLTTAYPSKVLPVLNAKAIGLTRHQDGWQVSLADGSSVESRIVVICSAFEAQNLPICAWLPLEPIRGQTAAVGNSSDSRNLRTIVCFDGYITPAQDGRHMLGAHYRHNDMSNLASESDTNDMIRRAAYWLPALKIAGEDAISSRVCFRTSTFDRLPYIGALPDFESMRSIATQYQPGTNLSAHVPLTHAGGLFVSLGHGSRGLLSCPLAGEIIARKICSESLGDLTSVSCEVDPSRVVFRELVRLAA
jgi:tRNA 5-methylaminomethyl-2-thiouridine biosynthesis bifunctional protein